MMLTNKITLFLVFIIGFNISKAQTDPSNIVCSATNSTTLQLTWTQASDPSIQGYFLHIERVDGLRIEPDIPSVDLNLKTYDSYNFYGLGQYGTYNITIHSYTSVANLTNYVTTCTTAEDVPNSAPQTFYCTGISTSSVRCTWSVLDQVYWNGVSLGFKLQWLSSNTSMKYETTLDANITTTLVTGLLFGTLYYFMLNPYTSIGQGTMYSTTSATTLGFPEPEVENVTRYYCNEAMPGFLVFSWEEMPCTIYTGTISALLIICGLFIGIICCMSCCSKPASNNVSLNFMDSSNGKRRRRRDDDGDDSEDDETDHDDDNDDNMTDDENNDDYDDDGYENKGYRSDEDARSPDSRKSGLPDDEINSQDGTPDFAPRKQSEKMDEQETKKMDLERQLTARDVQLEAISEDEAAGSDSDYDSQYNSDYSEASEGIKDNEARASVAGIAGNNEKKAKTAKKVKQITAMGVAAKSTTRSTIATGKQTNATVALVQKKSYSKEEVAHKNKKDINTLIYSDNSPHVKTGHMLTKNKNSSSGKDECRNITPDNDWDDDNGEDFHGKIGKDTTPYTDSKHLPIHKTKLKTNKNAKTSNDDWGDDFGSPINITSYNAEASNMPANKRVTTSFTEDDDWSESLENPNDISDRKTLPNRQFKSRADNHVANEATEPNGWDSVTSEEPYTKSIGHFVDNNSKLNNSNTRQRQNSARTNEFELNSFNSSSDQNYKMSVQPSNKGSYSGSAFGPKRITESTSKELDEDDEWGSGIKLGCVKRAPSVSHKATHFRKMQNISNTGVLKTLDNQSENRDMSERFTNKHSGFDTVQNEIEESQKARLPRIDKASNIGLHTNAAQSKQKMASKSTITNNSKLTDNHTKTTVARPQENTTGITKHKDQSVNRNLKTVDQNENQNKHGIKNKPENKKISFRDQQTEGQQYNPSNSKTATTEHKNMFFIEDEIDDVKLPNDNMKRPDSEPTGKKISTRAWQPQSNNSTSKSGRKTPVKTFPKVQSWTAIDIEPVVDSDRLGKKFPFLSIDNITSEKTHQKDTKSINHLRKNVSDSELTKITHIIHDDPSDPSVTKRKSEGDVLSKLSEPRDKIFYGFGTGRFRHVAAKWIGKFRAKKNPVKTANTAW